MTGHSWGRPTGSIVHAVCLAALTKGPMKLHQIRKRVLAVGIGTGGRNVEMHLHRLERYGLVIRDPALRYSLTDNGREALIRCREEIGKAMSALDEAVREAN